DVAPGLAVAGREDMFETILENLIDNALSFSPPGEPITVRAKGDNGTIIMTVADNGPGVAPDQLNRIFERYYSSRFNREQDEIDANGGIHFGIGLWLVRQQVQALGGTVTAENQATGGLVVTVRIPRAEPDRAHNLRIF